MPLEIKDRISVLLSSIAILISILTFAVVQHRQSNEDQDKEGRLFQSMYTLGSRMELIQETANDIRFAAPSAVEYQRQLEKKHDDLLIEIQMTLDQWELKTEMVKFVQNVGKGIGLVADEIKGRYGIRAFAAYVLGGQAQSMDMRSSMLAPGTDTSVKCRDLQQQIAISKQPSASLLDTGPDQPDSCEINYLNGFPNWVQPMNSAITTLGGSVKIASNPKTVKEAAEALQSALWALQAKWQR